MIAIQPKTRQILGFNQQSYQALKSSMGLNLRRQLLIAVCDNVEMQNQLATQLEQDLSKGGPTPLDASAVDGSPAVSLGDSMPMAQDLSGQLPRAMSPVVGLERLIFDPEDGNLPKQVANWVRQTMLTGGELPMVQVLGIEQMTRQPAITQNHFLRSLEKVEGLLPRLNTSLLVWLPWPWLRTIQQSATTFWNWRTGLFEFVSDPVSSALTLESSRLHPPVNPDDLTESRDRNLGASTPVDFQSQATSDWPLETDLISDLVNEPSGEPSGEQPSGLYGEGEAGAQHLEADSLPVFNTVTSSADDLQVVAVDSQPSEVDIAPKQFSLLDEALSDAPASDALDQSSRSHQAVPEPLPSEVPSEESVPTAKSPRQHRVKRRKRINLGVMGGLRTVVSKGVNAANAQPQSNEQANEQSNESPDVAMRSAQAAQDSSLQADSPVEALVAATEAHNQSLEQSSEPGSRLQEAAIAQVSTEPLADSLSDEQNREASQQEAQRRLDRQKAADDYFTVGMVYRTRIENGERGLDLIEPAIAAYEGGLRCLTGPHPDWGSGLNDLGTLYWLKAQQIDDEQQAIDCMTHSIQLYQEALDKLSDPTQPADSQADDIVGQLYSNMGAVYTMLATHEEPVSFLTQAAVTYQKALPLYSLETEPMEYATLQNSLGSVYWKLAHYDTPTTYLHRAISAYNSALTGYVPEHQPLDYAAVQNNLGITYWSLAKYEQPVLLLKYAISAYRDALNYRTPEVDPAACAITYNNLALAYWDLSKDGAQDGAMDVKQRTRYQKNAVTAFEAALNTSKIANSLGTSDRAAIFHCLGDVHIQMADTAPSLTEVATCLQKSLYSYLKAIEGVPADSPLYQGRLSAIVANLRAHYDQLGLAGQQAALNRVPPDMLSLVMLSL